MAASPCDLITVARAKQNLPSITDATQDANLQTLITAASRAIEKFCRRDFVQSDYDELYTGDDRPRLLLRQFPVLKVASVRAGPATVLKIQNTDTATNQQARVRVTSTGLTLTRVASGTVSTNTVTFAGNATLTALAAAVAALGNGWTAQVIGGYTLWPAADLYCPNGLTSTRADAPLPAGQGDFSARDQVAELAMHTAELAGFQLDPQRGWLLRALLGADSGLWHADEAAWPGGTSLRVQYSAGFASVPEDVQEACTQLVVTLFKSFEVNHQFHHQSVTGAAHTLLYDGDSRLPRSIRTLLAPYQKRA